MVTSVEILKAGILVAHGQEAKILPLERMIREALHACGPGTRNGVLRW